MMRSQSMSAGMVRRMRTVLLTSEDRRNADIAELARASRPKVNLWRSRYQGRSIAGLADEKRSGRLRTIDHAEIVPATLMPPPKSPGVTRWSSRLLAAGLKIPASAVVTAWCAYGIKSWRSGSFRFSTHPELVGKVTGACGLYLAPPESAIVLCVDEKPQIQALDRTQSILPKQPALIEQRSHGYVRHDTSTPFVALDIATGQITAALKPRHRNNEFLAFLKQIERGYRHVVDADGRPAGLHLVRDNYAAHKHANVKAWLADNPRFTVHFAPAHASWTNLVEVWFGIVERQAIRPGVVTSVNDLNAEIRAFIDGWDNRSHSFVWTRTSTKSSRKPPANRLQMRATRRP